MKRMIKWMSGVAIFALLMLVSASKANAQYDDYGDGSYQMFYDDLAPYGQWIQDPEYGYVWAPNAGNDFRPYYTNGRWAMTEYGNTWVSNYDWGWAPFHYGRWTYSNFYGWIWIPGNTWGPAWVTWRNGGGNYGWAPMGPGISLSLSFGSGYYAPNDWWIFVPCQHIYASNYGSYWRGPRYNTTYINQTTIINNTYNNTYVYGPRRNDVERATGRKVTVYNVRNERTPGRNQLRNNTVNVFRPQIASNTSGPRRREAPRNFVKSESPIRESAVSNGQRAGSRAVPGRQQTDRNANRVIRPDQPVMQQGDRSPRNNAIRDQQLQQQRPERLQRDNAVRQQQQAERSQRDNAIRQQQVDRSQRDNSMRQQQLQQQQAERSQRDAMRQQQMQQQQAERSQRDNAMRQQQMQQQQMERSQRDNAMRQQQMQQQQAERSQRDAMRQQQIQQQQAERSQRDAMRQQQMQQQQAERSQRDAMRQQQQQQREWRRPEPQQRQERAPMQRSEPQRMERGGRR